MMFCLQIVGELVVCNTKENMTMISLEWHSQAVCESLWFVRSDLRIILVTAGKDGYVCIGTMVSDKIKLIQRLCRFVNKLNLIIQNYNN